MRILEETIKYVSLTSLNKLCEHISYYINNVIPASWVAVM